MGDELMKDEWLWKDQMRRGEVSMLVGPSCSGKTLIATDLAARVSSGAQMPGSDEAREPETVLMFSDIDPWERVHWPRLEIAGVNRAWFHAYCVKAGSFAEFQRLICEDLRPSLVVIDALFDLKIRLSCKSSLRRMTEILRALAEETGAAILVTDFTPVKNDWVTLNGKPLSFSIRPSNNPKVPKIVWKGESHAGVSITAKDLRVAHSLGAGQTKSSRTY